MVERLLDGSMSCRILFLCLSVFVSLSLGVAAQGEGELPLSPEDGGRSVEESSVTGGLRAISSLQAMLEFFFMEAGVYPATLEELNTAYNSSLPAGSRAVPIPVDPASGKPFVYLAGANRKGYVLRFPDATSYGLPVRFEMQSVSWGWLALRAERKRFEELAKLSKHHMEGLATQVEMYAKDNQGRYPEALDVLFPKYINRHPQDPITGKNYSYKPLADGYLISSPNPERYGLRLFQYSSSRGMVVEALSGTGDP